MVITTILILTAFNTAGIIYLCWLFWHIGKAVKQPISGSYSPCPPAQASKPKETATVRVTGYMADVINSGKMDDLTRTNIELLTKLPQPLELEGLK